AAVSAFGAGDHLRRAWWWLAAATVAVLIRDLLRLPPLELSSAAGGFEAVLISGLGVLSNAALLAGIWLLARAWKVAAIALPGGRSGVAVVTGAAAVLALVVAGPGALRHGQDLFAGDWSALTLFVSAVVDILSLCLLAPLLLTAVGLRGGLFAWPWALITASMLCWLLYDAAALLTPVLALGAFPLTEVFRGLAENYLFAAGTAQRLAVRSVRTQG
ncbi:MAG: hypothetical protein PVG07_00950, partial [Acidobacteriota bacterium]